MQAAIITFVLGCGTPVGPYAEWFDETALPTVHIDDLLRFHDPLLAIRHGAGPAAINQHVKEMESRWWDMNNRRWEYDREMIRLRWTRDCWSALTYAAIGKGDEDERMSRLRALRNLLGPSAYYAGWMPDFPIEAVPLCNIGLPMPRESP